MKNIFSDFFHILKNICIDIIFLYKNFFHWNISKFFMLIWSFLVGVILSLPFFLLMWILAMVDPIEWSSILESDINIYMNIAQYIAIHPLYILAEFILFVLGVTFLFLWMSYHVILESNLYLHYFNKQKLPFKKNHYFDPQKISTYFGILGWIGVYLLLPICVLLLIFFSLFLIFKFLFLPDFILYILLSIAAVVCGIWFLYLSYRLSFSYIVFVDNADEEKQKSKSYVQKSLSLTSWKVFFKFLWIAVIFMILLAPLNIIGANIDNDITDIRDYFGYKSGQIQVLNESDQFEYEYLSSIFSEESDEELVTDLQVLYVQQVVYTLLFFLFVSWVFSMIMVSFYKRALVMQWSKVKDDNKKEKQKKEKSETKKKSSDKEKKKSKKKPKKKDKKDKVKK